MGKKTPAAPAAPDPNAVAQAQGAANREAAIASQELNMVSQFTPYGKVQYGQTGTSGNGNPLYGAFTELSPNQQAILDRDEAAQIKFGDIANNQLEAVGEKLSTPLDFSESLGTLPVANEQTRLATRDAIEQRNSPYQQRDRSALETRLANQGIGIGSEAYNDELERYQRGVNDFRLAADAQAGNEMSRVYGLESNSYDRQANQLLQERQIPLNETLALSSNTQVQNPNFVPTPQTNVGAAPIADATYSSYQGNLNNYNQKVAQQNAQTQGLYSLLGSAGQAGAMAFSDRRLKRDITGIGKLPSGLGLYEWQYVWGGPRQIGVMADEVRVLMPHAVKRIGGFDAVNYAEIW